MAIAPNTGLTRKSGGININERDVDAVVTAANMQLDIVHAGPESGLERWAHLSLCIIDAVFSINARYSGVIRVCDRYAKHAGLTRMLYTRGTAHPGNEEPLSRFAALAAEPDALVTVFGNRGRTSARGGILKADAAARYARILVEHDVETLAAVELLLANSARLSEIEKELALVPGHGTNGVRLGYFWMLAGDNMGIKPDRMVLAWLRSVLCRSVGVPEARALLLAAAQVLACSPWELDHAVWLFQRGKGR